MSKIYFIYKTTNLINNKFYIGQHCTNNIDDGYIGSGNILKKAISKYGKDNFEREIIEYCNSYDELNEREKYWISFYNGVELDECYNILEGGNGGSVANCQKTKDKIANTLREYYSTEEMRTFLSESRKIAMNKPEVKEKVKEGYKLFRESDEYRLYLENMKKSLSEYANSEEGNQKYIEKGKITWEYHRELLTEKMIGNEYCAKTYEVMNEDGIIEEVTNFTKFCKEKELNRTRFNFHMGNINDKFDDLKYCQGYKVRKMFDSVKKKKYQTYKLTLRDGSILEITNLKKYCKDNSLNESAIYTKCNTGIPYRGILIEKL